MDRLTILMPHNNPSIAMKVLETIIEIVKNVNAIKGMDNRTKRRFVGKPRTYKTSCRVRDGESLDYPTPLIKLEQPPIMEKC